MDMRELLNTIVGLQEAAKPNVTVHAGERYGGAAQEIDDTDSDDEDDGKTKKAEPSEKRGRGRPRKEVSTRSSTDDSSTNKKYSADALQKATGSSLPKKLSKPTKKHTLKDWIETVENTVLSESEQITIKPAQATNTQVIQQGNKTLGTVNNPALASQIKAAIGKGEMSLAGDQNMAEGDVMRPDVMRHTGDKTVKVLKKAGKPIGEIGIDSELSSPGNYYVKLYDGSMDYSGYDTAKEAWEELKYAAQQMMAEGTKVERMVKHIKQSEIEAGKNPEEAERIAWATVNKRGKLKENVMLDESPETLEHIINKHKHEVKNFMKLGELDEHLYDALFDYYLDSGEMPYGIAKARTGDPDQWVAERFSEDVTQYVKQSELPLSNEGETDESMSMNMPSTNPFEESTIMTRTNPFESWEKQLNTLLNEGMTVTSSTGQAGAPDSVSINATDADAQELLSIVRQAGLGVFGAGEKTASPSAYGAPAPEIEPEGHGTEPELSPDVVDDGDDMLSMIKKMSGIQASGEQPTDVEVIDTAPSSDYEDEEGAEEIEHSNDHVDLEDSSEEDVEEGNAFSGAVAKAKSDNIPDADQKFKVGGKEYPVKEEHTEKCNECGMYEGECKCDEEQVEESLANSNDDAAMQDLQYMLDSLSGGLNGKKRSQATGNITQVTTETTLMKDSTDILSDWKKLSGI